MPPTFWSGLLSNSSGLKLSLQPSSFPSEPSTESPLKVHAQQWLFLAPQNTCSLCPSPHSKATSSSFRCWLQQPLTPLYLFLSSSICCWNKTAWTGWFINNKNFWELCPCSPWRSYPCPYIPQSFPPQDLCSYHASDLSIPWIFPGLGLCHSCMCSDGACGKAALAIQGLCLCTHNPPLAGLASSELCCAASECLPCQTAGSRRRHASHLLHSYVPSTEGKAAQHSSNK